MTQSTTVNMCSLFGRGGDDEFCVWESLLESPEGANGCAEELGSEEGAVGTAAVEV